jgi:two-component system OmpR family response regulator
VTRPPPTVLVVDDEDNIAYLVASALRLEGFRTETAATGRDALARADAIRPDLVILDVGLADLGGFEVLHRLRDGGHAIPVIFLTARDATEDRVRGLTLGGDDYVVKPFAIEELVARAQVALRRSGRSQTSAVLRYADLEIDDDAHRVTRHGRSVALSPTEYKLVRFLTANAEKVVSRSQILDHVWDYDFRGGNNVVDTFISYLRRKLDVHDPRLIQTVRGVGYSLRLERQSS